MSTATVAMEGTKLVAPVMTLWTETLYTQYLACFLTFICLLWIVYRFQFLSTLSGNLRGIPYAKGGHPVFGHGLAQFQRPRGEAFSNMADITPNDGLVRFRELSGHNSILLTSPEALSEVLVRSSYAFVKPPAARKLFSILFGRSLLVAEGEEHKMMRKNLQPLFTFRKVQNMYPAFWQKAVDMNEAILKSMRSLSWTTDIAEWSNNGLIDAIGLVALGVDLQTLKQPHEFLDLFTKLTSTERKVQATFVANAVLPQWILSLLSGFGPFKMLAEAGDRLRHLLWAMIEEEKTYHHDLTRSSILRGAIETECFTTHQMVDQFLLIIGAGHEPTAAAFVWAIWFLAKYPEWQQRLRQELRTNIDDQSFKKSPSIPECLESLPILNAVISETLRYRPTTPFTTRICSEDTLVCGRVIPKGTRVYIAPYVVNRLEALYGTTAKHFDPQRWIDESGKANNHGGASSNYAFITFLHGPRKCIGDGVSKAELRCFLAAFVRTFTFKMEDPHAVPNPVGVLATKPEGGLKIILERCDGSCCESTPSDISCVL